MDGWMYPGIHGRFEECQGHFAITTNVRVPNLPVSNKSLMQSTSSQ